jgi:hypothetical protein
MEERGEEREKAKESKKSFIGHRPWLDRFCSSCHSLFAFLGDAWILSLLPLSFGSKHFLCVLCGQCIGPASRGARRGELETRSWIVWSPVPADLDPDLLLDLLLSLSFPLSALLPSPVVSTQASGDLSVPGQRSTLENVTETLTTLFPVWVCAGAALGIAKPAALAWFKTDLFTYSLGFLMLSMGLTLTVDDFRQCLKNPVPVRGAFLSLSFLFSRASFLC